MKIISEISNMQQTSDEFRIRGKSIALVPTMGYFHNGHLELMKIAKQNADVVVTTLFVNPTQFGPSEDFNNYPRDIERDKRLAESSGTDILFIPPQNEMYPPDYLTYVEVEKITKVLEGKFRPSHFRGVATVVAKLFNITKPHIAVFGQKDAQQAVVIKQMVKDLNFDIKILVLPIVRDSDGLAMSSRNVYLTSTERKESVVLFQSLQLAKKLIEKGERNCNQIISEMTQLISTKSSASIDYISMADAVTLQEFTNLKSGDNVLISLAVRFGATRLIDNITINI